MNRSLMLGFVFLCLVVPLGSSCSCLQQSPEQAINMSSSVFSGTVTEVQRRPSGNVAATIVVNEVWKGPVVRNRVVTTPGSSAACGYPFEKGQSYLVYTQDEGSSVSLCSRTATIEEASEDLRVLGDGKGPDGAIADNLDLYVLVRYTEWVLLAGLLLLGAIVWYRDRLVAWVREAWP